MNFMKNSLKAVRLNVGWHVSMEEKYSDDKVQKTSDYQKRYH
jgi:hypothetical protein